MGGEGQVAIWGFDPGVTTGVARLAGPREKLAGKGLRDIGKFFGGTSEVCDPDHISLDLWQVKREQGGRSATELGVVNKICYEMMKFPEAHKAECVLPFFVCEGFDLRVQTKDPDAMSPIRLQARIEQMIAGKWGLILDANPLPSHHKTYATDERLKMSGLYEPTRQGGLRHARDAVRLTTWFAKKHLT